MSNTTAEELAPIKRVVSMCGISKSNIYRRLRDKTFPAPIKVGSRALWPISRLHAWVNEEVAGNNFDLEQSRHQVGTESE